MLYLFDDFKIACMLHNLIFKPVKSSEFDLNIADRMISFYNEQNNLAKLFTDLNLNSRRLSFQRIENSDLLFPELTIRELCLYSCRTYAIKLAASYFQDHLNVGGDFEFQLARET